MKKIFIYILRMGICVGKIMLNIIYSAMKLFPTRNKVTLLSRQYSKPSTDFQLIEKEILKRKNNIEVKILCKTLNKNLIERIKYCFYIIKCMYHVATSKVCIIDGYSIPISMLKHKKEIEIIQIWLASGAIKKFGYQSLNKKEGRGEQIAKIMNMHKNYSHVIAPSDATAEFYAEAFNVDKEKIIINGLPRLDYILDESLGKETIDGFYKQYSKFKDENKKTILYVPTFRKENNSAESIEELIKSIDFSRYNLIVKLHPLDKTQNISEYSVDRKYNTFDLIKIADYIITDYSAVAFEAAILDKPLYFYVYDIEKYTKIRGLNINLFKEI